MNSYIKGLGVYVGRFNEDDLKAERDKTATIRKKAETDYKYKYVNTKLIRKDGKIIAIEIYLCTAEDFKIYL